MKFNDVYGIVGGLPCTEEKQCRVLYDWILECRPTDCLELGFLYGKTSCVIAAALHEIGGGRLTSVDLETVRNHQNNPNILHNLEKVGLQSFVTPIFSQVSYTWELKKMIERETKDNVCHPCFDFIFLDGSHFWETDVCAFFLAMKLLKPGGWFLFDDYLWSIEKSDWWHKSPETQGKPDDYRKEPHVERLITLVVSQHCDIESVIIRDNWVWARKKSSATTQGGASVTQLTKTMVKRWLIDKICGR
jgi:predicted O-methyltransferase YrrM